MPQVYTVRDNETGRTVKFQWNGDAPPTEADLSEVFAASHESTQPEAPAEPPAGGMLPTGGAFVGSLVGTLGGIPGRVAGAAVGGALGKGAELLADEKDDTALDSLKSMGVEGLKQGGYEIAGVGIGKGISALGKGAYKGGVALLPRTLKEQEPNLVKAGLREGVALTRRGAAKAGVRKAASRAEADRVIAAADAAGAPPIRPSEVTRELRTVGTRMKNQAALGLPNEVPQLAQRAKAFAKGGPLSLTKAQTLKREAQDLAQSAYKARDKGAVINEMGALTNEAQGRGLRQAIERRVPQVAGINARTADLGGLERAAEHASGTGHILSRLGSGGLAAGLLGAGGLVPAAVGAGAGLMLGTPGGLSSAGLALNRIAPAVSHLPQGVRAALLMQLLAESQEQ